MENCDIQEMLIEREAVLVREYDAALDLACFDAGHTILDVATGSGRMLLQILRRGYVAVSGDIDRAALDRARERLGEMADRATLLVMDAHGMMFDDDSFSAATLVNAIHEMDDPRAAFDEIRRVLTSDGRLLVVEFNVAGFELMKLYHEASGRGKHPEGEMSGDDIDRYLRSSYSCVELCEFSITNAWLASHKRLGRDR